MSEQMEKTMSNSVERVIKIWDDNSGCHFYVGQDGDGLGLPEIRFVDSDGEICDRMTFSKEQAVLVAKAILELFEEK